MHNDPHKNYPSSKNSGQTNHFFVRKPTFLDRSPVSIDLFSIFGRAKSSIAKIRFLSKQEMQITINFHVCHCKIRKSMQYNLNL